LSVLVPKKVKEALDQAVEQMNEFPNRLRQYQAFEEMKLLITKYRKMNITIVELRSDAMKPRHWKALLSKLKINLSYNDLYINTLWKADLQKHDKAVKDIMNQARGEHVLEEFLRGIKEVWNKYELDLAKY
jgi:dynein heavy chain 1